MYRIGPVRVLSGVAAAACGAVGLWLAAQHPLAPAIACALWMLWLVLAWRKPDLWLAVVPAGMPLLSLAPWSGWNAVDESDLLVLAALAAGHARLAWRPAAALRPVCRWRSGLLVLLALSLVMGLVLAWIDVQRPPAHASGMYTSFANSLRVGKAMAYALLAVPLLCAALQRSPHVAQRRLGAGMGLGLAGLALAVLWERRAIPGLLDFNDGYRTVGLFWEMHVGGAAIDAYLALAVPFAVWAVVAARRPSTWLAAAVLAQVLAYVCLTTFARGVYGAVLGGLVVVALLVRWQPQRMDAPPPWRARANAVLRVVLVAEVVAMTLASSFLTGRLREVDNDFGSRIAHWARGLSIVQSPQDWLAGVGLGRLPERYADLGAAGEFPGAAVVEREPGGRFLRLFGPPTRAQLAGRYALTQQVALVPGVRYRIAFDLRMQQPTRLRIVLCERHLLYERACQYRFVPRGLTGGTGWQHVELDLMGHDVSRGSAWAPRRVSLELAVVRPGGAVDLDNLRLSAGPHAQLLRNGDFEQGMARWYPVVDRYVLPWHIDNLYLELLIERGLFGLLAFLGLAGTALWRLSFGAARGQPVAPYLAAALAGGCALGLVSSIMDMPRVAFLFLLLLFFALYLPAQGGSARSCAARSASPSQAGRPGAWRWRR